MINKDKCCTKSIIRKVAAEPTRRNLCVVQSIKTAGNKIYKRLSKNGYTKNASVCPVSTIASIEFEAPKLSGQAEFLKPKKADNGSIR